MKSSKWILGLTAIMLVLVLAPSGFAQVNVTLSNSPSSQEVATNRTGQTSDPNSPGAGITVSGALLANSTLTTTQLVLIFPMNITTGAMALDGTMGTGTVGVPSGDGIQITGATGLFASITAISSVQYNGGVITITLPGFGATSNTNSGSFRLTGVRGDLTSGSGARTLTTIRFDNVGGAAGSGNANNYNLQTTSGSSVSLISATGNGIASLAQGVIAGTGPVNNGTITIFSNQTGSSFADSTATVVVTEGFVNAWRNATQESISGTVGNLSGTGIRLSVTGIPPGVTLNLTTDTGSPTGAFSPTSLTSTATSTIYTFTNTNVSTSEQLGVQITITGTPTSFPATQMTMTATMAPVVSSTTPGLSSTGLPQGTVPRFNVAETAAVTIGNIVAAQTTLLIPYATVSGNTFDVAMAISNTTKDPFTTGSATAASGVLQFDFFPTTGAGAAGTRSTLITGTSLRPGSGLDASGNLVAGATWTGGLKSDLLPFATPAITGDFVGYIFIQTNFLDAHGVYYLVSKSLGTAGSVGITTLPIMVLDPPAAVSRTNGGANARESLGF